MILFSELYCSGDHEFYLQKKLKSRIYESRIFEI